MTALNANVPGKIKAQAELANVGEEIIGLINRNSFHDAGVKVRALGHTVAKGLNDKKNGDGAPYAFDAVLQNAANPEEKRLQALQNLYIALMGRR